MIAHQMPDAPLTIRMTYSGNDVDNGTMPVDEVISALQGFSGAYGKVANSLLSSSSHELRVSAIDTGSFEMAIVAWVTSANGSGALAALKSASTAAKYVFSVVKGYIDAKKHIEGKAYQVAVNGSNNTTVIINADNASLSISPEILGLLKTKLIDGDLTKIASPLQAGSVDGAQLTATGDGEEIRANISSNEKDFFGEIKGETARDISELTGSLVSLNKDNSRGTIKLGNGNSVPYRYIGEHAELFHSTFAYSGPVSVSGIGYFDENLDFKRIEIKSATRLQRDLALN